MTKLCVLAALLVATLAPPTAAAYVRMRTPDGVPLQWRRGCPAFTITAKGGPDVSSERITSLIEAAREAWMGGPTGCSQLPVEIVAVDDVGDIDYDGANQLLWRDPEFCLRPGNELDELCLSPNAAAVTTLFYYERGERAGEIVEIDTEINGQIVFGQDGESDRIDLLSALTHELGHALGLEHTCETIPGRAPLTDSNGVSVPYCTPMFAVPPAARWATMFPYLRAGETYARTPEDEERSGVCDLYHDHAGRCEDTGPGCGCGGARDSSPVLALFVLAFLVWIRRR